MIFLKLGGSLITDKDLPHTPRLERIDAISAEIKRFLAENPDEKILIGHGSGSFGHIPAKKYGTRSGVRTPEQWLGFHEVWHEARALNLFVIDSLLRSGISAISFSPSACISMANSTIKDWNVEPILSAMRNHFVPVLYGDVVFDSIIGGTILSTEEIFFHLAPILQPQRILLAGIEAGVWEDLPERTNLYQSITPETYPQQKTNILQSGSPDVTGGMLSKVESMLQLVQAQSNLTIQIFSGIEPESIYQTLNRSQTGTQIRA